MTSIISGMVYRYPGEIRMLDGISNDDNVLAYV